MTGHRRRGETVLWRIYVPAEIAIQIELALADPIRGKPIYGSRSQLVSALLQDYVLKLKQETPPNVNYQP